MKKLVSLVAGMLLVGASAIYLVQRSELSELPQAEASDAAQRLPWDAVVRQPLYFEPNRGQADRAAQFMARSQGYTLLLAPHEARIVLQPTRQETSQRVVRMTLVSANAHAPSSTSARQPGESHYLRGSDPKDWHTHVPHYGEVRYREVYDGIDLVYYGNPHRLQYDFVVDPGIDPQAIALDFDGMDAMRLDEAGNLVLEVGDEQLVMRAPVLYQELDEGRHPVAGAFVQRQTDRMGFEVGAYDPTRPLVIDPELVYATYLGGSAFDAGAGIALDAAGNAYVAGRTDSEDFSTINALQGAIGDTSGDVFVTKLSPDGTVLYATYLGGTGQDFAEGLAVGLDGSAYVTGHTSSGDFPLANAAQSSDPGAFVEAAFISKLSPDGASLVYSTYLAGSDHESGVDVAVDASSNAYVTGWTRSSDFPAVNALQPALGGTFGQEDAFVTKLSPNGAISYSTYLGGSFRENVYGIDADLSGSAYVIGFTSSRDFPTVNAIQTMRNGFSDVFVTKLSPDGASLTYSTYLGGSSSEFGRGVAVDTLGHAYIVGETGSSDFPTVTAFQDTRVGSSDDAFVAKLSVDGSSLIYSTYLGGVGDDKGRGIAVDARGVAHVVGYTRSFNFPIQEAHQDSVGGTTYDTFVSQLSPDGSSLLYSTYLGGSAHDYGDAIAVDDAGNAWMTGWTQSDDFPVVNGVQQTYGGDSDALVVKFGADESAIVVNDTGDESDADLDDTVCDSDGVALGRQCTLRAAIETANTNDGPDTILFNLGGATPVIHVTKPLPALEEAVTMNGQLGDAPPTRTEERTFNSVKQVAGRARINGASAGSDTPGFRINAPDVVVQGLEIHNFDGPGILVENVSNAMIGGSGDEAGNVLYDNIFGLQITGRGAMNITVQGNCIGAPTCTQPPALNRQLGISVTDNATHILLGGDTQAEGNQIFGGISVFNARNITLRNNELEIPLERLVGTDPVAGLRVPYDLDDDGPSCLPWNSGSGPHDYMVPPRVLSLSASLVTGRTAPGATVEVFKVVETGQQRGRYFARHVKPVGHATADSDGAFRVAITGKLASGDLITVTATDTNGTTSELAQVKRPVIFVPGIGGSNLAAADGTELWLPDGSTDETQNTNLYRMRGNPDGSSAESVQVPGVLESVFGLSRVYGPALDTLQSSGFTGHLTNANSETLDLWRYAYDWRLDLTGTAAGLKDVVHRVTGGGEDVAKSCEVDLIAHSMGGLVSSLYLRGNPIDSQNRVHRFVSMAVPYLGTPQATAGHTMGYIFGLEETPVYGTFFDVDWDRMLRMTRNLPAVYALTPSRAYWDASIRSGESYLVDFYNDPMPNYDAVSAFISSPKTTASGAELGLFRNATLGERMQTTVHDVIDDWRGYDGPPHVFRLVGDRARSTAVGWQTTSRYDLSNVRRESADPGVGSTDDTVVHRAYRSTLEPVLSRGDGTVALSSATLGHLPGGLTDLSGVESPWIEAFEPFPCLHMDIVGKACQTASGLKSLERMLDIVQSGYKVPPTTTSALSVVAETTNPATQEVIYVYGDHPLNIEIRDSRGRRTGPIEDNPNKMRYEIPNLRVFLNNGVTVISVPDEGQYEITIQAPQQRTTSQVVRLIPADEETTEQVLFPEQVLVAGGQMRWTLDPAASTEPKSIRVDADGDGSFEQTVPPAAALTSTSLSTAIPVPQPVVVNAEALQDDTQDLQVTITLPDVGGPIWQWTAASRAAWIIPTTASGQTPENLAVTLAATTLPVGRHTDTLAIALSFEGYTLNYPVAIHLNVAASGSPTLAAITPQNAEQGALGTVLTLRGQNFQEGATVVFSGSGIAVTGVDYVSATQLQATITIAETAPIGLRSISITNPDGQSTTLPNAFEVLAQRVLIALLQWDPPPASGFLAPPQNVTLTLGSGSAQPRLGTPRRLQLRDGWTRAQLPAKRRPQQSLAAHATNEVEPNNTSEQANVLSGSSPLVVTGQAEVDDEGGVLILFDYGEEDDIEDLYRITTTAPGMVLALDGTTSDCDLYLLNENGTEVIDLSINIGATESERVEDATLPAGTYLVGVSIFDPDPDGASATPYTLRVEGAFADTGGQATLESYNIYRGLTPNSATATAPLANVDASTTIYADLLPGEGQYYYQVTAVYAEGESVPSEEATLLVQVALQEPQVIPTTHLLGQNYPNPFSAYTTIPFEVAEATHVVLRVYDVLGRHVETILDAPHAPGRYEVPFEGYGLPAGLYMYELDAGAYQVQKTMLLLR